MLNVNKSFYNIKYMLFLLKIYIIIYVKFKFIFCFINIKKIEKFMKTKK